MAAQPRLVILDRDGVINYDSDAYIKTPDEFTPIPGSIAAIARLCSAGYRVAVVSNQSGIGRGLLDSATLEAIHAKLTASVEALGGRLAGIYVCPHVPADRCDCRKPRTGLLERLKADLGLETLEGVPMVGDKPTDLELAAAVGARGLLVRTGKGAETSAASPAGTEVFADLAAVADTLVREAGR